VPHFYIGTAHSRFTLVQQLAIGRCWRLQKQNQGNGGEPFSPNRIGEVRERESYLFLVGVVLLVKQVTCTKTI
jgi:hypothetical protein